MRRYDVPLVRGSVFALPFADASFDCVICSQVIDRVPRDDALFAELSRVLRPGGLFILATPDSATLGWRMFGPLHALLTSSRRPVTRYSRESLSRIVPEHGFEIADHAYVFGSELVLAFRKLLPAIEMRQTSQYQAPNIAEYTPSMNALNAAMPTAMPTGSRRSRRPSTR
jgi:ubiquinone/menaquinone biosynthesis C-methylase UbiE